MADAIKFFFDHHMPKWVAEALRRRGVDVLTAIEAGRSRAPDDELLRFADADGRVIATQDQDFLRWVPDFLARGEPFAGVAYCDPDKYQYNPRALFNDLIVLHGVYTADDMRDHLEYL